MRAENPQVKLVFVGDGPARTWLQSLCPGAHFAGLRVGDDLAAHYASDDLFAIPSLTETFGTVTAEAMASGLPVLAYDCAAAGMLIRSADNGVLVSFDGTPERLRQAAKLAREPQRLRAMGVRARATASELSWQRITEQFQSPFVAVSDAGRSARGRSRGHAQASCG